MGGGCAEPQRFGVTYNGGYHPDAGIDWIKPDDNTVVSDAPDAPIVSFPPAPAYFKTCEARRFDPRSGGIPTREIQFDDQDDEPPQLVQGETFELKKNQIDQQLVWNLILVALVILFVIFLSTKF